MRYSSRTFISLLVIAGLLSGVVLVAPPAAAASTTTWTSTADFDSGEKAKTGDIPIGNVTLKTPLPVFRSDGSSAVHNNQLYQIAGYNENGAGSPVDTMYRYTPATDSWETLTPGPRTRWGHRS